MFTLSLSNPKLIPFGQEMWRRTKKEKKEVSNKHLKTRETRKMLLAFQTSLDKRLEKKDGFYTTDNFGRVEVTLYGLAQNEFCGEPIKTRLVYRKL